jgi:hypothetical protein
MALRRYIATWLKHLSRWYHEIMRKLGTVFKRLARRFKTDSWMILLGIWHLGMSKACGEQPLEWYLPIAMGGLLEGAVYIASRYIEVASDSSLNNLDTLYSMDNRSSAAG